jgi:serine/threonine-protein kinase
MVLRARDRIDRYEVIELLGSGGMGEVYRARDRKLARLVALKILRVESTLGTEGAARLLREARATASLAHPNVVAVYDVGEVQEPAEHRGLAYIAMEIVDGASLRTLLGDSSIPLSKRVDWMRDVASALVAAHDAGIVHRDIKPENVMVRADGLVKVLDFGIARRAATSIDVWSSTEGHSLATNNDAGASLPMLTGQGAIVGTPFYMAPEQLRGEVIDARADQFAWGVVAYALLTGKFPWPGGVEPLAVLSQILSLDPTPPAELDAAIPAGLSRVILRALAKKREDRFPSMSAVLEALGAESTAAPGPTLSPGTGTSGRVVDVEPPSAARSGRVPRADRKSLRTAAIVAALLVALGAGGATLRARRGAGDTAKPASAAPASAPAGECTVNADCVRAHGGEPWHCNTQRHACIPVASPDCKVYAEPHDAEASDVVWLGGLFPFDSKSGLVPEMRGADLARREFAQVLGPSAGRGGALHARPIAVAMCDEGGDPERALRHLVEDVEVPAVIGFRSSATALSVIPTELLPNHVLSFVSISQAPAITRIPQPPNEPRLIWRSTLDRDECVRPLAALVSDVLEPKARAAGLGTQPLRVATVWGKSASHDMVDALFAALHFNGKDALSNGSSFRQFVLEEGAAQAKALVEDLVAFAPNIVFFADEAFVANVLPGLEAGSGARRPTYVTEDGLSQSVAAFVGADAGRRHRFFAATNVSTTMANAELVLRYNMAYPREPVLRTEAPQPSYDAFYALAYATYALGDAAVTGPALSGALDRLLPPGRRVSVGPAPIYEAFGALRAGERIDLVGAIGPLDFDRAKGEAPIDYSIVCLGKDDRGLAFSSVDSGLVYDARANELRGVLHCP